MAKILKKFKNDNANMIDDRMKFYCISDSFDDNRIIKEQTTNWACLNILMTPIDSMEYSADLTLLLILELLKDGMYKFYKIRKCRKHLMFKDFFEFIFCVYSKKYTYEIFKFLLKLDISFFYEYIISDEDLILQLFNNCHMNKDLTVIKLLLDYGLDITDICINNSTLFLADDYHLLQTYSFKNDLPLRIEDYKELYDYRLKNDGVFFLTAVKCLDKYSLGKIKSHGLTLFNKRRLSKYKYDYILPVDLLRLLREFLN